MRCAVKAVTSIADQTVKQRQTRRKARTQSFRSTGLLTRVDSGVAGAFTTFRQVAYPPGTFQLPCCGAVWRPVSLISVAEGGVNVQWSSIRALAVRRSAGFHRAVARFRSLAATSGCLRDHNLGHAAGERRRRSAVYVSTERVLHAPHTDFLDCE